MDYYELNLQRKKAIEEGLLALMQEVPFSQITITGLTQHVGMSRKCFYHYFPGKEACLESLIDRMIQEAALHIAISAPDPSHPLHQYVLNLEYWKSRRSFLEAIARNTLDAVFQQRCMVHNMREEKTLHAVMDTPEAAFDEDILLFWISGHISLLMNWCRRGFEPPVEEMARKFRRLLRIPLIQPDKE